jgi:hypothetical protein
VNGTSVCRPVFSFSSGCACGRNEFNTFFPGLLIQGIAVAGFVGRYSFNVCFTEPFLMADDDSPLKN